MDFLKIDGGYGEGGGQIVRSAVALSCITKQPIHLEGIRKNRKTGGLRPQHLAAISILQKISDAEVTGAEIGSTELRFVPGEIKNSDLVGDVGTAGSIPLILQVLVPAVAISQGRLDLKISGGTDVLWSPTIDYTRHVLGEAYSRMGIEFSFELIRRGYYPRGNGEIKLRVNPAVPRQIRFSKRRTRKIKLLCSFSKLPRNEIADEVGETAIKFADAGYLVDSEIKSEEASDSGASLLAYGVDENSIIGTDALYDKKTGKFGLKTGNFISSRSMDDNLADMLIVPASLRAGKTVLPVREITKHLETNLFITSKITGCRYGIGKTGDGFEVIIEGVLNPGVKQ